MPRALVDFAPSPARPEAELFLAAAGAAALLHAGLPGAPALALGDEGLLQLRTAAPLVAWREGGLAGVLVGPLGVGGLRVLAWLAFACAAGLVGLCARRLGLPRAAALVLALGFAAHPLRVEAAWWLSRAGELVAFTLALALLACALRLGAERARRAVPLALLALFLLPALMAARPEPLPDALGLATRLTHAALAPGEHLARWLLVGGLSWFHPHPVLAPGTAELGLGALTTLATLALVVLLRRRVPLVAGGLAFFLLTSLAGTLRPRDALLAPESEALWVALGLELALLAGTRPLWSRRPRTALALALLALVGLAARTRARQHNWRDERALVASALDASPGLVRAELAAARLELAAGRLTAAERDARRALERAPEEPRALLLLGELELRRALIPGQEEHLLEARRWLTRARAGSPRLARVLECLGEVHQRGRDEAGARTLHEEALALEPHRPRALELLGKAALTLGDVPAARTAFARLTAAWPRNVEGWAGSGHAALAARDGAAARTAFERALTLEPDHPEANAGLAQVLELDGERAAALVHYRRALAVNPDLAEALYAAALLVEASAPEQALAWLERLVAQQPAPRPHVRAHQASARLLLARGELELARARLEAILAFNPEQAEARALLAELERAGR